MSYDWFAKDVGFIEGDDFIVDHTYISEENFLLLIILTNNGCLRINYCVAQAPLTSKSVVIKEIWPRWPHASALCLLSNARGLALILPSGSVLVVPIKSLIDVPWGTSVVFNKPYVLIEVEGKENDYIHTPTAAVGYDSLVSGRPLVIYSNKAGQIFIVDLQTKQVTVQLGAPLSIHFIDIISSEMNVHLLVTGFTGAQWILPLEMNGCNLRETLAQLVPSELRPIESGSKISTMYNGSICFLDVEQNKVNIYEKFNLDDSCIEFNVPENTWLVHFTNNVIFAVTDQNSVQVAAHFGTAYSFHQLRFEKLATELPNERIIAGITIPLISSNEPLPTWILLTERQMIWISPRKSVDEILTPLITDNFCLETCDNVAEKLNITRIELCTRVLNQLLKNAKVNDMKTLENDLILKMIDEVPLNLSDVFNILNDYDAIYLLLPFALNCCDNEPSNEIRHKVIAMFICSCKQFPLMRNKIETRMRDFLSNFVDISDGIESFIELDIWNCVSLIVSRSTKNSEYLARYLAETDNDWPVEQSFHIVKSLWSIKWCSISHAETLISRMSDFLPKLDSIYSISVFWRIAENHLSKFPIPSTVLYVLSSIQLLNYIKNFNYYSIPTNSIISCGSNCIALISEDEQLIHWGKFSAGPVRTKDVRKKLVPLLESDSTRIPNRICSVSCGTEHIVCITVNGEVYSFGENRYGQCGVGHKMKVIHATLVDGDFIGVRCVKAGHYHSVLVDSKGKCYSWGWGLYGQLGLASRKCTYDVTTPQLIELFEEPVIDVSCGYAHTVFLTASGEVFTCGCGSYGQLGTNDEIVKRFLPQKVVLTGKGILISSKYFHSLVLTDSQKIFQWGISPQSLKLKYFLHKQLRSSLKNSSPSTSCATSFNMSKISEKLPENLQITRQHLHPVEIEHVINEKIVQIDAGCTHSALITSSGQLYTWGKSLEMQLGHGNKKEQEEPHQLLEPSAIKWRHVSCGFDYTSAVTSDGNVYVWGRNDKYQLGTEQKQTEISSRKILLKNAKGSKFINIRGDTTCVPKPTKLNSILALSTSDDLSNVLKIKTSSDNLISLLKSSSIHIIREISSHLVKNPIITRPSIFVHLLAGDLFAAINIYKMLMPYPDMTSTELSNIAVNQPSVNIESELNSLSAETQESEKNIDALMNTSDPEKESFPVNIKDALWEIILKNPDFNLQWNAISDLMPSFYEPILNDKRLSARAPLLIGGSNILQNIDSIDKLTLLENWQPDTSVGGVNISQKEIQNFAGRIVYWNCCGTVEKFVAFKNNATLEKTNICTKCSDKWKNMVKLLSVNE